jgi:hypothetical protein
VYVPLGAQLYAIVPTPDIDYYNSSSSQILVSNGMHGVNFFSVGLVDEQNLELFLGVPATCSDFAANIQGRFS